MEVFFKIETDISDYTISIILFNETITINYTFTHFSRTDFSGYIGGPVDDVAEGYRVDAKVLLVWM